MKGFLWGVNVPKQLHCLLKLFGPLANQGRIYGHFGKCANVKLSFHSQALSNLLSVLSVWERESCDQIFMLQRIHACSLGVLFVLKHVIFTTIVWPFIFRNFIWLNCRNSNCVTLCAMLQSIRCHFQVWTFTCPFNRMNKNSTKKPSNKEIQSFTSVNLFGFLSYVSNTIN